MRRLPQGRRGGLVGDLIMGSRGGDQRRLAGLAALETSQPAVSQGEEAQAGGQPVDGPRQAFRRRMATLRQALVQGQQVEQQLHAGLGRTRRVAAVGQHRPLQRRAQPIQNRADQSVAGGARQGRTGDPRRSQALGLAFDIR